MTWPHRSLRRFLRSRDGGGAIELALTLPIVFGLFMAAAESALYMTRDVMLERAMDLTVRELRLGLLPVNAQGNVEHTTIKQALCDNATILPDCANALRLSMQRVLTTSWDFPTGEITCTDRVVPGNENPSFRPGGSNELMVIRACMLQDPVFPGAQIGQALARDGNQDPRYAIVATSAYVVEPNN